MTFSTQLEADIAEAYRVSHHRMGWRLLYSPARVLEGADVAFIGLNPGGSGADGEHGEFAVDAGSAYCTERWGSTAPGASVLQRQVRMVFRRLDVGPEDVLAGNLVPFRSRDWASLDDPNGALR